MIINNFGPLTLNYNFQRNLTSEIIVEKNPYTLELPALVRGPPFLLCSLGVLVFVSRPIMSFLCKPPYRPYRYIYFAYQKYHG